jgi:4-hydroxymandelate oxidase
VRADAAGLEERARGLLPPDVYDYYAGGSGREQTLQANTQAWRRCSLLPRVLRDVSVVDTGVMLPGRPGTSLATPVAVAPVGFQRLAHPDGECATAEGAARAGALMVLSTRSTRRIEEVGETAANAGGAWWFQVYMLRDRRLTAAMVERAVAAGARALVLTADTPEPGLKRRDRGGGFITPEHMFTNTGPLADPALSGQAADVTFADIGWLAELGGGVPVVVKGVLRADDAAACVAAGAAGVIVSNHGGRQLDGAVPTAHALPVVASALAGTGAGVYVDSGLRTAEDVLTALALGARAVFLGRPVLWALTCGGADGVRDLLTGITANLAHAMALAGAASLADTAGLANTAGLAGTAGMAGTAGLAGVGEAPGGTGG